MSKCGRKTEVWSRSVGYYRPLQDWVTGKRDGEWPERKPFKIDEKKLIAEGAENGKKQSR